MFNRTPLIRFVNAKMLGFIIILAVLVFFLVVLRIRARSRPANDRNSLNIAFVHPDLGIGMYVCACCVDAFLVRCSTRPVPVISLGYSHINTDAWQVGQNAWWWTQVWRCNRRDIEFTSTPLTMTRLTASKRQKMVLCFYFRFTAFVTKLC